MGTAACERQTDAMTPDRIEQKYGVGGAYSENIATGSGTIELKKS